MRSALRLALPLVALGGLAAAASAQITGQLFEFADPLKASNAGITSTNAQFNVNFGNVGGSITHVDSTAANIIDSLVIYDFDAAGKQITPNPTPASNVYYYLADGSANGYDGTQTYATTSQTGYYNANSTALADPDPSNPGVNFNTENAGLVTFVDSSTGSILLQLGYSTGTLSSSGAGSFGSTTSALNGVTVDFLGGSLLAANLAGTSTGGEFTYQFGNEPNSGAFRSSGFIGSIGNAPTTPPVPEPAPLAAVALGGLVALRRRRRA